MVDTLTAGAIPLKEFPSLKTKIDLNQTTTTPTPIIQYYVFLKPKVQYMLSVPPKLVVCYKENLQLHERNLISMHRSYKKIFNIL